MRRFTVIIVPNDVSAVRRFGIDSIWLRRAAIAGAVVALLMAGATADWIRLRREAPELARLRLQAEEQRAALAAHAGAQQALESELTRLHELERRVRVIANLPKASLEQAKVARTPRLGVGGGGERPEDATPPIGSPVVSMRTVSAGPGDLGDTARDSDLPPLGETLEAHPDAAPGDAALQEDAGGPVSDAVDPSDASALLAAADALRERAHAFSLELEELADALRGRSERLAATPVQWPADGWLTSRFGYRMSPFTGRRDFHAGIDIAAEIGTPVLAPATGRVAFSGRRGGFGNAIVIDHGYGIRTTYGHLQTLKVHVGERVERGAQIATIGNTGLSTGPHLHYAVEVSGKTVDPLDYIIE